MTALHELTGQYLALANDEDIDPQAIADTLEAISGSIQEKAVSLADWALDLDGNVEKIDAAIARLEAKKKQLKARRESLNEYLLTNMQATGINKIQCDLFTITLIAGRDSVAISDESLIPDDFLNVKTVISPDKTAIAKAIKEGQEVAGATLQKGRPSIKIK
jgi:hypothetical protein